MYLVEDFGRSRVKVARELSGVELLGLAVRCIKCILITQTESCSFRGVTKAAKGFLRGASKIQEARRMD